MSHYKGDPQVSVETIIVMIGNPIDGVTLHGPFTDADECAEWCDTLHSTDEWWVVPVSPAK